MIWVETAANILQPEELLALGALLAAGIAGGGIRHLASGEEPLEAQHALYTGEALGEFDSLLDPTGRDLIYSAVLTETARGEDF